MTLQATTFIDIPDQIQTLTYTLNGSEVDQISFIGGVINYSAISSFNLIKSDSIIYVNLLSTFLQLLIRNFPNVQSLLLQPVPLSSFELQLYTQGVEHMYFTQTSLGETVYNTNYVPLAKSAGFSSRSAISITLQEFFLSVTLKNLFSSQINFN